LVSMGSLVLVIRPFAHADNPLLRGRDRLSLPFSPPCKGRFLYDPFLSFPQCPSSVGRSFFPQEGFLPEFSRAALPFLPPLQVFLIPFPYPIFFRHLYDRRQFAEDLTDSLSLNCLFMRWRLFAFLFPLGAVPVPL